MLELFVVSVAWVTPSHDDRVANRIRALSVPHDESGQEHGRCPDTELCKILYEAALGADGTPNDWPTSPPSKLIDEHVQQLSCSTLVLTMVSPLAILATSSRPRVPKRWAW